MAGLTAARLLARKGVEVRLHAPAASAAPTPRPVTLSMNTARLLGELWELEPGALGGAWRIEDRLVYWGEDGGPVRLPEAAISVDLGHLTRALHNRLVSDGQVAWMRTDAEADDCLWHLDARGRQTGDTGAPAALAAGRRVGLVAAEVPADSRQARTSRIEALSSGWVYIGPCARDRAIVQAVLPEAPADPGDGLTRLLVEARLAAAGPIASPPVLRAAAPRLARPVTSGRRLRIGDAALALDPLAGDGVGHALRGALLAVAVLRAVARGEPEAACLVHYAQRLNLAFVRHLKRCLEFYARGRHAGMWADERRMMTAALARAGRGGREDSLAYRLESRDRSAELLPVAGRPDGSPGEHGSALRRRGRIPQGVRLRSSRDLRTSVLVDAASDGRMRPEMICEVESHGFS